MRAVGTGQDGPDDLVSRFRASARTWPERTALSEEERRFTYAELDAWSESVARLLRVRGVAQGDRVVLRMPPGADCVAAVLGILKCGAAYVPLDVRHPVARREFIAHDSAAETLVGSWGDAPLPPHISALLTEEEVSAASRPGAAAVPATHAPGSDETAYIIYTSGTTGEPKGVPVRHRHVQALLDGAADVFTFTCDDRWLLFHSVAFDFSVWEMWGALSTGAELVVLPQWAARSPDTSLRLIAARSITVLNQTPTAFASLADAAARSGTALPALRYIIFGGEKLSPPSLRSWAKQYGMTCPRLVNGYGITETTVFTTFHEVTEDDLSGDTSVIGEPLPGFVIRVVDDQDREAPVGEKGELWLAGPQVTDGYLNRPELTADKFPTAPDPATGGIRRYYRSGDLVSRDSNGSLVYDGRVDLQVKLRGYRIELSDIEAAVRRHEAVLDTVVTLHDFKASDTRLVCAYVTGDDAPSLDPRQLRQHMKSLLPSYMHPARYLRLAELPRTVNGKVDRAAIARSWKEETQKR
ncbi:amino acid adenylation domain-containing protein [Streptomyces sp. NBC_00859]|uniref:amino acid adenylation domain-containing protein n=1 Tax=Streptomyces sp. NBC_00859 TaxID=2903682 RepID=UPI00386CBB61|nr:amino acid adenylation domain-containing protein [Streptomyces sp. NBC_00859]